VNENDYKSDIVNLLKYHGFHVETHEDKRKNFIPDVSAAGRGKHIWIEVKYVDRVPATLGSIAHYTRGQEQWLADRGAAQGGGTFLWLGTPTEHFIWAGTVLPGLRSVPFNRDPNRAKASVQDHALAWDASFIAVGSELLRFLRGRPRHR
jgi:hypothetical protein